MVQRAHATIDTAAMRANLRVARERAPGARLCAAVKADAYGHGLRQTARALDDADALAVAEMEAALRLREAGETRPVMLLSDPLTGDAAAACAAHQLEPVLYHADQLEALAAAGERLRVWIKLDTGMHRLGFPAADAALLHQRISAIDDIEIAGWLTHLAYADDPADATTAEQLRRFRAATAELPGVRSIANSAGVCAWPDTHAGLVRPGIMLYGASPLIHTPAEALGLTPAMTLRAPLISVKTVAAGERIGYGGTWQTPEAMPVGVVAIGYGDGYPRHAPSDTPVLLHGRRVPLVGRVSMDMITVDLRGCPEAAVGDTATLWGAGLPADDIAAAADTIAYELFCRVSARVTFVYE